ncbi:hypothetical protein SAMN04487983_1010215 [Streptomyces sp. yr375]|uniref:hypothetical protein n=1 Tax=Streptomyces sp. yr375 TaxID=1761906 RepID=UPI0008B1EF16|nr:hypothetical protein [Streptomyces sp. yr375]SER05133.1 hypothetical protein SAMN04487983_1010215 [Streptomyces sp. yr375]
MEMRTWRESRRRADDAATALREALAGLDLPESQSRRSLLRHLRPVVTHTGTPFVHVGMVRAEHVERIAEALRVAAGQPKHAPHSD